MTRLRQTNNEKLKKRTQDVAPGIRRGIALQREREKETERQTDRQADRQTDRQMDAWMDAWIIACAS